MPDETQGPGEMGLTEEEMGLPKGDDIPNVPPISETPDKQEEKPGVYDFINDEVKETYPESERLDASAVIGGGYLAGEKKEEALAMMRSEMQNDQKSTPEDEFELARAYDIWSKSKQMKENQANNLVPEPNEIRAEIASQVEKSRETTEALVALAIQNGAEPSSFDHLEEVWKPESYYNAPTDVLPPNVKALTLAETGDVFIREDNSSDFHTIFHESIHRSAHLRRIRDENPPPAEIVAGLYGFTISPDGKTLQPLDPATLENIPEADREGFLENWREQVKAATNILVEGLTEWAVQRANGLKTADGQTINISKEERLYPLHTEVIDSLREVSGLDPQKADALLIETALTGDLRILNRGMGDGLSLAQFLSEFTPIFIDIKERSSD